MSGKWLSQEHISNMNSSLWQAGLFCKKYTTEQKLFNKYAILNFSAVCVRKETFKNTNGSFWIGKQVPISVSISSNIVNEPFFFATLVIITSLHPLLDLPNACLYRAKIMWNFHFWILWQQQKLNWAATWRNSIIVTIGGSKPIWMIVTKKIVALLSCYWFRRINYLHCTNFWNNIAYYYLCLVSRVQNIIAN